MQVPAKISSLSKRQRQKRTVDSQRAFLMTYANTGSVTASASAAGVARKTHYSWLKSDVAYAASFQRSKRAARDYHVDYSIYDAVTRCDSKLLMKRLRKMKFGVRR
jgi:hypothetical protein